MHKQIFFSYFCLVEIPFFAKVDFYNLNNNFFNEISAFFPLNNKNILANFVNFK